MFIELGLLNMLLVYYHCCTEWNIKELRGKETDVCTGQYFNSYLLSISCFLAKPAGRKDPKLETSLSTIKFKTGL